MKIKSLLVAALIATIGITACSKSESGGNDLSNGGNGETKSMHLKLSQGNGQNDPLFGSRAEGSPVTDKTTVIFNDGVIYFTSAKGDILKTTVITNTNNNADATGSTVGIQKLTVSGGAVIPNVPATVDHVYIAGNLPTGANVPMTGNISNVEGAIVTVQHMYDASGDVSKVVLFGDADAVNHPTDTDAKYAKVDVNAIAARIEIGEIKYRNNNNDITTDDVITSFDLEGIFINHYYSSMTIDRVAKSVVKNGSTEAFYAYNTTEYPSAINNILYDANVGNTAMGIFVQPSVTPSTAGKVWAYNLLAPDSYKANGDATASAVSVPHIVIRLGDIVSIDDDNGNAAYPDNQWLTVTKFYDKDNSNAPITKLEPGMIYKIASVKFDESNLTPEPEIEPIKVYVEAELMEWTTVNTEVDF